MRTRMMKAAMVAGMVAGFVLAFAATTPAQDHDDGSRQTYQTANLFQVGSPTNLLGGGATLFRSKQRLVMRIATSGLDLNSAYTVWWVVFNNPAGCSAPGCGQDDLANPAARPSVFYAAGFVTGIDGTGNVSAAVDAGPLAEGIDIEAGRGLRRGYGFRAEVHLVIRTHGMINPG
ncbi:MAG: hypothetical protein ACRDFA_06505, partial [bacterium]